MLVPLLDRVAHRRAVRRGHPPDQFPAGTRGARPGAEQPDQSRGPALLVGTQVPPEGPDPGEPFGLQQQPVQLAHPLRFDAGVQEAVLAADPGWGVVTVQVWLPAVQPAVMAAGEDETQVNGALGTMQPCTSTAVAVRVSEVPLPTTKLVSPERCVPFTPTSSAMHCTGQVSKL